MAATCKRVHDYLRERSRLSANLNFSSFFFSMNRGLCHPGQGDTGEGDAAAVTRFLV